MTVKAMDHFTVLAADLDATREFYRSILGLEEGYRPPFGFPGAWLYADGRAILHVIAGQALPKDPAGVLDHMAFSAAGLKETIERLNERAMEYDLRRQAESNTWQLFFFDPSGAKVELDFSAEEPDPRG